MVMIHFLVSNVIWYEVLDALVPIGISVVLPVLIVWLISRARQNETNRKAEIMIKAIEAGAAVDPDFFKNSRETKTLKEKLLSRLTGACITSLMGAFFIVLVPVLDHSQYEDIGLQPILLLIAGILLAVGIALFIVYFVGKKMMSKEIEAEERRVKEE